MESLVALDIGTSGVKAALVDQGGRIRATGYAPVSTHVGAGHRIEQAPEEWWQATQTALAALWGQVSPVPALAGVALSGQMQDTILLGPQGAVGPAILYSDSRAQEEAQILNQAIGSDVLAQVTGNAQTAASVLAKWLWLARQAPERLEAAQVLLVGAHDYVTWRLCGATTTDFTTAATTGLLDLRTNQWAEETIRRLGLDPALLPALQPAGTPVGTVHGVAAEATGLPAGTPVFQGAGDLGATTVGVGAGVPGRIYCYLGTSGWIASTLDQADPMPERGLFTLRHPNPAQMIQVAPMLTAGGNLDWLRGMLGSAGKDPNGGRMPLDYARINAMAAEAPAGSHGVIYLPYLAGERSPFSDPNARACFLGISAATTGADLARAVMEGTALAYRSLRDALGVDAGAPLLLVGGGAKSPVWSQILADVLQAPVQVVADPGSAPARGAAVLAGVTLGWFDGYFPAPDFFPQEQIYTPALAHGDLYDRLYGVFAGLYPHLQAAFGELAAVRDHLRQVG